jgi:hypothetical protein
MPKIINMKSVKECIKSMRPVPPAGGPDEPPAPPGEPDGALLPPEGPDGRPPPPPEGPEEGYGNNDVGENTEAVENTDGQNSGISGQLQHRPGRRGINSCKDMFLPNIYILHKDR